MGPVVRFWLSCWIGGLVALSVVVGLATNSARGEDIPDVPRPQDIQIIETCLNGIDARGGERAEGCLNRVEQSCENQFGSNTIELAFCRKLEAATWAVLLDHELAYNVLEAKYIDARCATDWRGICMAPGGKSLVEETLRRSQVAWVAMLSTTCDYKYRAVAYTSARNPDYTACLRELVYERHQFFWRRDSAACECNIDSQLEDLHYDGEVVPFAFRRPTP